MDAPAQTMTLLEGLAERIAAFGPERVSQKGLEAAKAGIADTIGVTLAGLAEPCTQLLLATPGVADGPGPAVILGTDRSTSLLDATLVNGTASHALDFDDFSDVMGGHQSVPLVAPLLASAAERPISGMELITAYVAGLEVEHRFAEALHPEHYDKGWHPTATLGIFGTVAALAHAHGLSAGQTATALALAASLSSGLKSNFGSMTKPLHVGHSARSGMMAVLLAERGFTANPGTLEHHQGFLQAFNGADRFDPEPLAADWDGALHIEGAGLGIKQFPCCGSTHQAIAAALELQREHGIAADKIHGIEIRTHPRRLRHTDTPRPQSALQAKFSVQYVVARAFADGSVRLRDFKEGAYEQPLILRLLSVTRAGTLDTGPWDAEVHVTLSDGRHLGTTVRNMVGRSGENAMTREELREKFLDCTGDVVPGADAAFDTLMVLDALPDVAAAISANLTAR